MTTLTSFLSAILTWQKSPTATRWRRRLAARSHAGRNRSALRQRTRSAGSKENLTPTRCEQGPRALISTFRRPSFKARRWQEVRAAASRGVRTPSTTMRARSPSNDSNPWSRLYQTVARISVLGRRRWFVLQQWPTRGLNPSGGVRIRVAVIPPSEG
jgi:hypothetical protein